MVYISIFKFASSKFSSSEFSPSRPEEISISSIRLKIIIFTFSKNRMVLFFEKQDWESCFGILLLCKFVLIFPLQDFILAFTYLLLYTGLLSNSFFRLYLTYSQISLYFSNNSWSSVKNEMYLFSSKSFLYAFFGG